MKVDFEALERESKRVFEGIDDELEEKHVSYFRDFVGLKIVSAKKYMLIFSYKGEHYAFRHVYKKYNDENGELQNALIWIFVNEVKRQVYWSSTTNGELRFSQ